MAYKLPPTAMKKLLFLFVLLMNVCSIYAYDIIIEDSRIRKDDIYEVIKKWALTTLDSKDITILHEDKSSENIIFEGEYIDKHNGLSSSILHYVLPYVKYQLEIRCDSGSVTAEFIKLKYSYTSLNKSSYTLTNTMRSLLIKEHEAIIKVMRKSEGAFDIDDAIENEYNRLKPLIHDARMKKDDKTLSSKERRENKSFYEANKSLYEVYSAAHWAEYYMKIDIYDKDKTGLRYYVNNYLEKSK